MITRVTNPFDALLRLQRALDATRESRWLQPTTSARGAYPLVNVFQQGDDFVLVAEVPGVRKDQVEIQVLKNQVRLSGTKAPVFGDDTAVHRRERSSGVFDRIVSLPVEIDAKGVKAECHDGLLAVFMPRAVHERPQTIKIQ